MQAISPVYSTLYDAAPQIMRSCEPHSSIDTSVSRDKQCPEHKQYPQQQRCKTLDIFGVDAEMHSKLCTPLYHTTSPRAAILVLAYYHNSVCVAAKRCRYHAIGGSSVGTCGTYHTSTDGTVHYV